MISTLKAVLISIYCIIIAVITIIVSPFDRKGIITHYLSKIFGGVILFIAGVKVRITGLENLNKDETYVFISNHLSYFDIPILMKAIPNNVRFIYKDTLTKIPILGWGMYLGGYIPINRENVREAMKSLKAAASKILKGISVVIFPEGTRSYDGNTGEFKRGMFILAEESKVPLVPTAVTGSEKILPRSKFEIKPGIVHVNFSTPVLYRKDKNLLEEIRNIIVNQIEINK